MKNNTLRFVLFISLLLNISILATAGYQYYMKTNYWVSPFGYKMKKGSFLFEQLSLGPEQLKAMRGRAIPFRAEIDRRRQEIAGKREEMLRLIRAESPDRKAVDAVIKEISSKQEEMQSMIVMHILDEKAMLDKEQQRKFLDLIENAMKSGRQMGCPPVEHNQ
jgi:Spy/CpxP family protein refolding chaperone